MDPENPKSKKIYYSMGEVSEMFDVNPSLIRFWERKFSILKPDKNKKGNRLFTPHDVETLKLIYHLVKEKGMTLAGAEKRLKENREGVNRNLEIIEQLQGIKTQLLEIRQELKGAEPNTVEIYVEPTVDSPAVAEALQTDRAEEPAPAVVPASAASPEPEIAPSAEVAEEPDGGDGKPKLMQIVEQTLF